MPTKGSDTFGRPLIVHTETGSVYEVTDLTLKRMHVGRAAQPLRQDGETLNVIQWVNSPKVGERFIVGLAPLHPPLVNDANVTFRISSRIVAIDEKVSDTAPYSVSP